MTKRRIILFASLAMMIPAVLLGHAFLEARADPVVRRAEIALPGWPAGTAPVTVALIGDVHIGSAAMDAGRLTRIVAQVNGLRPDLVVIVGDLIAGHEPDSAIRLAPMLVEPLARLRPPLGTVAVLGNHDHWTGANAVATALRRAGVRACWCCGTTGRPEGHWRSRGWTTTPPGTPGSPKRWPPSPP